jgi:proteasome lid subunit RPN8/RPN11
MLAFTSSPRPPAPGPRPPLLTEAQLREIVGQAEAGYPHEICGLVVGPAGDPAAGAVRQVRNVADQERPSDTQGAPRDSRSAYLMDPLEELRILREVDARGWDVVCIYHSHPDHPAYFSAMDRERALDQAGRPLWPDAVYLVVGVRGGRAVEAQSFRWDPSRAAFMQREVPLPAPA